MKAFYVDSMPTIGKYKIGLCDETYKIINTCICGSYNILAARVFGLSYADYLRMIRENYGATLKGKEGYITYTFTVKENAIKLEKELNRRWNIILGEK